MAKVMPKLGGGEKLSHKYGYTSSEQLTNRTALQKFIHNFKRNWQLHLMILLPLTYIVLFQYLPLYGIQLAFREFGAAEIDKPLHEADWMGLHYFMQFFKNPRWIKLVRNTLTISLYSLAAGFPVPIILALMLHVNEHPVLKKITQNVSYIPHFISAVVLVGILNKIIAPEVGLVSKLSELFFDKPIHHDLRSDSDAFYHLYVWSGVWQGMGWSAIMYVSALSGVPMELHEAARIDGASRFRRVLSVDLPAIMPTICILLILRFGSIMSVGHEKVLMMQYGNTDKSEVISTYVYNNTFNGMKYALGSAIGLMNSVINTTLVLLVNWITNKLSDGESGLF